MAEVFRRFGPSFLKQYRVSSHHLKVMDAIQYCRTKVLGGHWEACTNCGNIKVHYNSCGNRHCPSCQGANREKWILERKTDLLPVTYFHLVFTVPEQLRNLFRYNKVNLYNLLFKCVRETLDEFSMNPKWKMEAKLGLIAILHTWTQKLIYHPHVHCIVPGGGINRHGIWCTSKGGDGFLFHVKPLSKRFRNKFLDYLEDLYQSGELQLLNKLRILQNSKDFFQLRTQLKNIDWVVYSKESFAGADQVFEYLGRYTHRIAMSNYRIRQITDTHVSFSYLDRKEEYKMKSLRLTGEQFIERFLEHVLPPGFVKIRHYGFLSTRSKKHDLELIRKALDAPVPENQKKMTIREVLIKTTGKDPNICTCCREGKMVVFQIINPTRGSPGKLPMEKIMLYI